MESQSRYKGGMVDATERCNLRCEHCFFWRDERSKARELSDEQMVEGLRALQERYSLRSMTWVGGEPLLRQKVLRQAVRFFPHNHVSTNGTLPIPDLPQTTFGVSLDGPPEINTKLRGRGVYEKAVANAEEAVARGLRVSVGCTVNSYNQDHLSEFVRLLMRTKIPGISFSFYVPAKGDDTGLAWKTNRERDPVIDMVVNLKRRYPEFVRNDEKALELMYADRAGDITANCLIRARIIALNSSLRQIYCCYGDNVDCERCGASAVFSAAASRYRRFQRLLPPE